MGVREALDTAQQSGMVEAVHDYSPAARLERGRRAVRIHCASPLRTFDLYGMNDFSTPLQMAPVPHFEGHQIPYDFAVKIRLFLMETK